MADVREEYEIETYTWSVELKLSEIGILGHVSLWNEDGRVADLKFRESGTSLNPFRYSTEDRGDFISGDIDIRQRDAIIDLLRNESPIRLLVFHDDTPERVISVIRLATGRPRTSGNEPVGEGED